MKINCVSRNQMTELSIPKNEKAKLGDSEMIIKDSE